MAPRQAPLVPLVAPVDQWPTVQSTTMVHLMATITWYQLEGPGRTLLKDPPTDGTPTPSSSPLTGQGRVLGAQEVMGLLMALMVDHHHPVVQEAPLKAHMVPHRDRHTLLRVHRMDPLRVVVAQGVLTARLGAPG